MPNDRFSGSSHWGQCKELNQLLTYSQPLRDQFHLEPGNWEFEMTIHYNGALLDPDRFQVRLNDHDVTTHFSPEPGD